MTTAYPPLKTLKTFIVAAQAASFSHAAQQLNITQSAVSKQILQLESFLGCPLFERVGAGVVITRAGKRYLPSVIKAMETLQYATADVIQMAATHVRVEMSLPPSMASLWLIPRLQQLSKDYPEIELVIRATVTGAAVHALDCDIAVHCLPMNSADEQLECLREENLQLVVAKEPFTETQGDIEKLRNMKSLFHATRPQLWQQFWLQHDDTVTPDYGPGFEHFFMALEAAKAGVGMALIPDFLAASAINEGQVVNPSGMSLRSGYGYFMFCPSYKRRTPALENFIEWMKLSLQHTIIE
ncbi:LysR substrate-binding domain-containing protein [Veronia nyctiphanis]|uniref:LysR substrate-binding domain-containing protein n=1 Tax=Veronia nyctiphanis TaxID=1278244 RepID=UPI001F47F1B6|nr:LysR substrate-binding domain-containing protein [Veronia nyctiphanis]